VTVEHVSQCAHSMPKAEYVAPAQLNSVFVEYVCVCACQGNLTYARFTAGFVGAWLLPRAARFAAGLVTAGGLPLLAAHRARQNAVAHFTSATAFAVALQLAVDRIGAAAARHAAVRTDAHVSAIGDASVQQSAVTTARGRSTRGSFARGSFAGAGRARFAKAGCTLIEVAKLGWRARLVSRALRPRHADRLHEEQRK
jgi:hypothetical protein